MICACHSCPTETTSRSNGRPSIRCFSHEVGLTSRTLLYLPTDIITSYHPAIGGYEGSQHRESLNLLLNLIKTPEEYFLHFQRFSASLVFTLSFGQFIDDDGKALGEIIALMATFVQDTNPSAYLVDTFPILDWLPDCLAAWRVEARHKHQLELDVSFYLASKFNHNPELLV
jgi:hypothetical protein